MVNDLTKHLEATPEWAKLNAYERTKRCCVELTRRGDRIPSWVVIRNLIGKGSSNDINRGKKDFHRELGLTLRKIAGSTEHVSRDATVEINNLWATAANYAHEGFEEQVKKLQQQIELAKLTIARMENEHDQALTNINRLNDEIAQLKGDAEILRTSAACERLAREQVEGLLEINQQELLKYTEQLTVALDKSQKELKGALSRLEGTENHVLLEIDRFKTASQKKNGALENRLTKEIKAKEAAIKNLEHKFQVRLAFENENLLKTTLLTQENISLDERLQRAEALVDKLTDDNSQLIATIKQFSNK